MAFLDVNEVTVALYKPQIGEKKIMEVLSPRRHYLALTDLSSPQ